MKKVFIALLIPLLLWACKDEEKEQYILSITHENDSLIELIQNKNLELEEITASMNAIETNLSAIRRNEVVIDNLRKEGNVKQGQKINAMIREIDDYMEENRQQIEKLEKQLRSSRSRIVGLEKMVALQKQAVEEKEQQIQELLSTITFLREELQNTIVKKDAEIEQKEKEISKVINEKETLINTAFYRFGSREELMQDGIVQKESGGLLSGKNVKMASKFDVSSFQQVDITTLQEIDMGLVDKKNVITTHPSDSFYFVKTDGRTYLKIVNPQRFWSVSKYLVIETDG